MSSLKQSYGSSNRLLSINGAKYSKRPGGTMQEESRSARSHFEFLERTTSRVMNPSNVNLVSNSNNSSRASFAATSAASFMQQQQQQSQSQSQSQGQSVIKPTPSSGTVQPTSNPQPPAPSSWKKAAPQPAKAEDMVVIHVCDDNQQLSRDFHCQRNLLVAHMKYFQKFLGENNGSSHEDIDISVHCDVEIFEWLMAYIHAPDDPPTIDKQILVSILISSEFLQMDTLVELCVQQMALSLNEIVKLPIDLSCISEKLVNRIAALTTPRVLSELRDRKDKILSKLYKRRVELDFSRKGSTSKPQSSSPSIVQGRTIAASLTCCRHCGSVYLENYIDELVCRQSSPSIDFRGALRSRHASIPNWSLTSYLKSLHAGGMGWEAIYWHVWAACVVLKIDGTVFSCLEVDRYNVEPDGLLVKTTVTKETTMTPRSSANAGASALFSLAIEDDCCIDTRTALSCKLFVSMHEEEETPSVGFNSAAPLATASLNPQRTPETLTPEIFSLLCSQMKHIVCLQHKTLLQNTIQSTIDSCKASESQPDDPSDVLWEEAQSAHLLEKRRGRSPARFGRTVSVDRRKATPSLSKQRGAAAGSVAAAEENVVQAQDPPPSSSERRSRSATRNRPPAGSIRARESENSTATTTTEDVIPAMLDPQTRKLVDILKSLPSDLQHKVSVTKGPVEGVWMTASPLQLHPPTLDEMLLVVNESALPDNKKLEWQLDLMREFDEKRIDRFERFLVSKRALLEDTPTNLAYSRSTPTMMSKANPLSRINGKNSSQFVSEFYKDRGRQPFRVVG